MAHSLLLALPCWILGGAVVINAVADRIEEKKHPPEISTKDDYKPFNLGTASGTRQTAPAWKPAQAQQPKPAAAPAPKPAAAAAPEDAGPSFRQLSARFFWMEQVFSLQACGGAEAQEALDLCDVGDVCGVTFDPEADRYVVDIDGADVGRLPVKAGRILDADPEAYVFLWDRGEPEDYGFDEKAKLHPSVVIYPSETARKQRTDCTIVLDVKTAGVTMPAKDGQPGRQGILRKMKGRQNRGEDNPITLKVTEYEGAPAVEVWSDLGMIGYVPKDRLPEVLAPGFTIDGVEAVAVLGGYKGADGNRLAYGCCFDVRLIPRYHFQSVTGHIFRRAWGYPQSVDFKRVPGALLTSNTNNTILRGYRG